MVFCAGREVMFFLLLGDLVLLFVTDCVLTSWEPYLVIDCCPECT
jgi:hypothetical protein